jgi:uncharacterized phage infection (PIP) family protein YhgE
MRTLCGCLVAVALLGGCGESAEDKAQSSVCDARADIQKQVQELDGLTAATVTVDAVRSNLRAIDTDLQQIKSARSDLAGDRKEQVDQAWQTFSGEVKTIGQNLLTSLSAADAKQQLATSLDGLAASFRTAFAPVDCANT